MTNRKVTRDLAAWIVGLGDDNIPQSTRAEGVRTFVNWVGCALGGADQPTVDAALRAVAPFAEPRHATVLGRPERLDALHAALVNGISSHVLDYDDTHLKTIIHPAGPVASALLALAEIRPMAGRGFLTSMLAGIEVECRLGSAVYPDHYDRGWHITGTAGVFGAAAACGHAIGLSQEQMQWALSLAGTQSSGQREMFGTMTKSFHPGAAAMNGLRAALMAEAGFDSSLQGIEAQRGWANVLSEKQDYEEVFGELGTRWEAELNSYKPFACGIVIHPAIDGCQQIREEIGSRVEDIESVELTANYLVLELTGKREPKTGLEGKFSVYHAAATALLKGDGAPTAFTDEVVRDPQIVALRDRINATADRGMHEASVKIDITFEDGSRIEKWVERAIGSRERPLDDARLSEKFLTQAALVVGDDVARAAHDISWQIGEIADVAEVSHATTTGKGRAVG